MEYFYNCVPEENGRQKQEGGVSATQCSEWIIFSLEEDVIIEDYGNNFGDSTQG